MVAEQNYNTPHYRPEDVGEDPRERRQSHGIIRWAWQAMWSLGTIVIVGGVFLAVILWFVFIR